MRTEYRLWFKPHPEVSYRSENLYPTREAAAAASTVPDLARWRSTPNSGTYAAHGFLISDEQVPETVEDRIKLAVDVAVECAQYDGEHHKMWVIDQMVRHLTGDQYAETVGDDWDEGVAPLTEQPLRRTP